MLRAYPFVTMLNKQKERELRKIHKEYIRVAKIILNKQLYSFFKTGKISKSNELYKDIETFLSERYKDVIKRQVDGMLKSYISNRKKDFLSIIFNSSLTSEEIKTLCIINKYNNWFKTENHLARKIFKHVLGKNSFPLVRHINMQLNTKVYELQPTENTKEFVYWVELHTGERGKYIMIPLKSNTYFDKAEGKISNSIQINFNHDKSLKNIVLIKDKPTKIDDYEPKTDSIGVDIGLKVLMTTNLGDLFGQDFINKLVYYNDYLTTLTQNLNKNGIKKLSENRRYTKKVKKLKEFLKNEVNRIINRIVKIYKPKKLTFENLYFKDMILSKKMNRLLNNFGMGYIKAKLQSLNEEFGIEIEYTNPAYTSQQCSSCGYIDKENRVSRDLFICKHCGLRIHADVNAAINIERRSFYKLCAYANRKVILQSLVSDFVDKWFRNNNSYLSLTALIHDNKHKKIYEDCCVNHR